MAFGHKNYNKFIAGAATATLVATAVVPAVEASSSFTDVNKNYQDAVNYLVANGIAKGTSDTTFGTDLFIKRGDAAVMIAGALGLDVENAPKSAFTDLNSRIEGAVNALFEAKIISGKSETSFAPDDQIKRSEMAKIIAGAYKLEGEGVDNPFTDVNSNWDQYVDALVKYEITFGKTDTYFGADENVTRGQFALFMYRAKDVVVGGDEEEEIFEVLSIEPTTALVDANAEGQFLLFTVNNGKEVPLEELIKAGYEVEFRSTTPAVLKDEKTGELNKNQLKAGKTFNYQVVLSDEKKTIESAEVTVKVEDFAKAVASLDSYMLTTGGVKLTSNTLVLGEDTKGSIGEVKGKSWTDAELLFTNERLTFTSSDQSKVLVNANGELTPVSAGQAKIVVAVKDTEIVMEVPVKIATEKRKVEQVTASTSKVGLLTSQSTTFELTVTDQYGDPFKSFTADDAAIKADESTIIANVKVEPKKAEEGKYTATVTATKKTGNGQIAIQKNDATYLSIPVTVGSSKEVASRKLELQDAKADNTLDLNLVKKDQAVEFVYNEYNADGILIGPAMNIGTAGKTYTVTASNDNVVVAVKDGVITVTGKKAGTSTITIKEGTITRATALVTVEDTTPSIKEVTFKENTVDETTATFAHLLDAEGITLTSSDSASVGFVDGAAVLFVETASEADGYTPGADILLGTVDTVSADLGAVTFGDDGAILIAGEALAASVKGTFVLRVLDPAKEVISTNTITVDIK